MEINWMNCPKCGEDKSTSKFAKDKRKKSGIDTICKECRKLYRMLNRAKENARWARNYNDKKHKARLRARYYNPSAKDFICAVIRCDVQAQELAHLDYNKPIDVIPLCEPHHTLLDK